MTRLYRSQRDKKLSGLCGGLAEVLNVDSTLLRLIVVVTAVFSAGTVILLYVLASIVIPKEPLPPTGYPNSFGSSPNFGQTSHYGSSTYHDYSGTHAGPHTGSHTHTGPPPTSHAEPKKPNLDEMMNDVEKKALWKEIEELKAKLAKYEKGE